MSRAFKAGLSKGPAKEIEAGFDSLYSEFRQVENAHWRDKFCQAIGKAESVMHLRRIQRFVEFTEKLNKETKAAILIMADAKIKYFENKKIS